MTSYLTNRKASPSREFNFTRLGDGMKAPSTTLYPCVLTVRTKKVCSDKDTKEAYEFYDLRPTPRNPVNPLGLDKVVNSLDLVGVQHRSFGIVGSQRGLCG
jgi:hypothetical protein